jgi:hypothetical protein
MDNLTFIDPSQQTPLFVAQQVGRRCPFAKCLCLRETGDMRIPYH